MLIFRRGLYGNRLLHLPESIGSLTALTWLDFSNNRICSLPRSFSSLASLTYVSLDDNYLNCSWVSESLPRIFAESCVQGTQNDCSRYLDKSSCELALVCSWCDNGLCTIDSRNCPDSNSGWQMILLWLGVGIAVCAAVLVPMCIILSVPSSFRLQNSLA